MRALGFTALVLVACAAPAAVDDIGTTQQKIEGGDVETALPNIGMLEFSTGNFGTATLITPRVVVTAGHVVGGDIQGFYVGPGRPIARGADFSVSAEMKKYGISQKLTHPSYQCTENCDPFGGLDLDMGLVLLDSPASEYVPLQLGGGALTIGMGCSTTGYGDHVVDWDASDAAPFVKQKRSASVSLLTMDVASLEVQWGTGIPDHGDSGGPLFCNNALVGTTAAHDDGDDSAHQTELYVRLDAAMPWVRSQLQAWGDTTLDAPDASAPDDAGAPTSSSGSSGSSSAPGSSGSGSSGCQTARGAVGGSSCAFGLFAVCVSLAAIARRRSVTTARAS